MSGKRGYRAALVALACCAVLATTAAGCTSDSTQATAPAPGGNGTGAALQQDYERIVSQSLPAVVEISTDTGLGSGVVFDDKGHVVTNAHVVGTAKTFNVRLATGGATYRATLIGSFPPDDLAVIQIENPGPLTVAKWGKSANLKVGDIVLAMGNPLGLDGTVTNGLVSALGRTVPEPPSAGLSGAVLRQAIQTSADINPGNSGGALVNLNGEVVGIPSAAATNQGAPAPGIGFAIPSDIATDIARQIIDNGRVVHSRRAALGVAVTTVTDGTGRPVGVGVASVSPNGPAAKAGLQPGDVIVRIGNVDVTSAQELQDALAQLNPGDKVDVTYLRPPSTSPQTVSVTLAELAGGSP
jgi:S1-C subfamily serine protease